MLKKNLLLSLTLVTLSCKSQDNQMFKINEQFKSTNFNSRIRQIILHYTAGDFEKSLKTLDGDTKRQVSSHYLINNILTKEHNYFIYNIVPDNLRSWHAGVSEWGQDDDLNNSSIGIEIVNVDGNKNAYPEKQIEAVIFLVKQLIKKYDVLPINIVGHSDIAPTRKIDPGTQFPWKKLYDNGIGAWYDDKDIELYTSKITQLPTTKTIKSYLNRYGYKINLTNPNIDEEYRDVVKAFQRHFSPKKIDGEMSLENYIILRSLLKKYRSVS